MILNETRKEHSKYPEKTNMEDLNKYCEFVLKEISDIQCFPPQGLSPKTVEIWLNGYNTAIVEINNLVSSLKGREYLFNLHDDLKEIDHLDRATKELGV